MIGSLLLGFFALLSLVLTLWQGYVALRFPLHRRVSNGTFNPPITLLKPLKGCDPLTVDCLRSWLRQDYKGEIQVLFGVASVDDPVCVVVKQLLGEFPNADAQLIICPVRLATNAKVSTLIQLQAHAKHRILLLSDADVHVPTDLLSEVVVPFSDDDVGLVHCFYSLATPSTMAMRWEAVAINADFWSQVLQNQSLAPLKYALGAVMALRRERLKQIGGFEVLGDYLADDYQLGQRIARQGAKIVLSSVAVECRSAPMNWRQVWRHQLRWARTIRACKPWPYALSVLSNATLWPLLWCLAQPIPSVVGTTAGCLLARLCTAQYMQYRLTQKPTVLLHWGLVWVKDLLQFLLWTLAFTGSGIEWRGDHYRVLRGGKLVKMR